MSRRLGIAGSMEQILALGARIDIRPRGVEGFQFMGARYAVGVEYRGQRNATIGDDLSEIFSRLLEWIKSVEFCDGSQWTPAQISRMSGG